MKEFISSRYPDIPKNWLMIFIVIMSVTMVRNVAFDLHHYGWWSLNVWLTLAVSCATGRRDVSYGILALYYPLFHYPAVELGVGLNAGLVFGWLWAMLFVIHMAHKPIGMPQSIKDKFHRITGGL